MTNNKTEADELLRWPMVDRFDETRRMSRTDAVKQVKKIASDLGLG